MLYVYVNINVRDMVFARQLAAHTTIVYTDTTWRMHVYIIILYYVNTAVRVIIIYNIALEKEKKKRGEYHV